MSRNRTKDKSSFSGVLLENVSKRIRSKIVLDGVSALFPSEGVSGISGANGSGKTMLLRAIAGMIRIDSGTISVFGSIVDRCGELPVRTGAMIEPIGLWGEFTGLENLELLASLQTGGVEPGPRHVLERVGLDPDDRRIVRDYSLGMKQRLCLAQAIMGAPQLLLLDEPTNALDDNGKKLMRNVVAAERERGAAIVLVSHDLEELNSLSDIQFSMADGMLRQR